MPTLFLFAQRKRPIHAFCILCQINAIFTINPQAELKLKFSLARMLLLVFSLVVDLDLFFSWKASTDAILGTQ